MAARRAPTPSQTVGPFFGFALPFGAGAEAVSPGSPDAVRIEGRLLDGAGQPVPDGLLEAWSAGQFARCRTDAEGAFHFVVSKPDAVAADGRVHAPHLDIAVFARGLLRHMMTRVYFPDEEEANRADPALERVEPASRQSLVMSAKGGTLHFEIRLQGRGPSGDETVFFG